MKYCIFDIETDGLLKDVNVIHCLSYCIIDYSTGGRTKGSITNYDQITRFLQQQEVLVGHNIIMYDLPVLKKLLSFSPTCQIIDTLGLSWYLYIQRKKHGLESYTEESGVEKPKILDWKNLTDKIYIDRCEHDVDINTWLFIKEMNLLTDLYGYDYWSIINYINFKLSCVREQEKHGILIDRNLCEKSIKELDEIIRNKEDILSKAMPKIASKIKKPKVFYKKDGNYSVAGERWLDYLRHHRLPLNTEVIMEPGCPSSTQQIKEWLFSLGWVPDTFKENINKEKVPQISQPFGGGICESVKNLYEVEPSLKELDKYYMLKHRQETLKGILEVADSNDTIYSTIGGFTNTLRMKHRKPVVNLPTPDKEYGDVIRGAFIAGKGRRFCGCDMSALEDSTKQHYIYFFDPQYVKDMRVPGFDPHLDIGVLAELITKAESDFYKKYENNEIEKTEENNKKFSDIKKRRKTSKVGNFAMTYNAQPKKVSESCQIPLDVAENLYRVYWKRNWAIKATEKKLKIKRADGHLWLLNPVSHFWYYLKAEKDKFSTLNQGTGVYVFDTWLSFIYQGIESSNKDYHVILQYHDEFLSDIADTKEDIKIMSEIVDNAILKANQKLKLNIEMKCSKDFGYNYAECH